MEPAPPPTPDDPGAPARRLEALLGRVEARGLRSLEDEELLELGRCYRRTAALLARVRTAGAASGTARALNRLLARAYPLVHAQARPERRSGFRLLFREFPAAVRREARAVLVAAGLMLAGALAGALLVDLRPDMPDLLFGPGWKDGLEALADRHTGGVDWLPGNLRPGTSVGLMANNIRVSFLAFALGLPLCVGSAFFLGFNGLLLGAVARVVHRRGVDLDFWAFLLPHGVPELTALALAGAAGLLMGYALLAPGRLPRGAALRAAGRRAVPLLVGVVALLVLAGLIEGFLSPVPEVSPSSKLAFAAAMALGLGAWFGLGGREPPAGPPPPR